MRLPLINFLIASAIHGKTTSIAIIIAIPKTFKLPVPFNKGTVLLVGRLLICRLGLAVRIVLIKSRNKETLADPQL